MVTDRQRLGLSGEQIAARWLRGRGWSVLDERFRSGHRDIDLVVSRYDEPTGGRLVAFVEVRTRTGARFGSPLATVNWRKQHEVVRAARRWVSLNRRSRDFYRFDVVGVIFPEPGGGEGGIRIQYVPNAFWAAGFG